MPLATTAEINTDAARAGCGAAAFNVVLLEQAEAYVRAAEATSTSVILQVSENCVRYHRGLEPLGVAMLAIARQAATPVAIHLDHAAEIELVHEAIALGFTGVMYDGSQLSDTSNAATTAEVVKICHAAGVPVEAELGEVGGKDGVHAPNARTDPDHARRFVTATGVDALAVAVGTSHAMTTREAALDYNLITALRTAANVPLVLHGSSGVTDQNLLLAVAAGITKVNMATHLNKTFSSSIRDALTHAEHTVDPRRYMSAGRDAVEVEAARILRLVNRKDH